MVWHSFGVTHVPRVEDWPVMPKESVSTYSFAPIPASPQEHLESGEGTVPVSLQDDHVSLVGAAASQSPYVVNSGAVQSCARRRA